MSEADPPRRREVGYGRPPVEHRFKKGVSGNPRGRPKRESPDRADDRLAKGSGRANQLLMKEAYRTVTLREGDQVIKLPAIQAIFRAMGVSAMKGNRYAQRTMAELVQNVENARRQTLNEYLQALMEYKCEWERNIEDAISRGLTPPEPVPHPDDIIIDFIEPNGWVCGPMTKEDKVGWDRLLGHRDELQLRISEEASAHARARSLQKKAFWLCEWVRHQEYYDELNDNLPQRYRKHLKDRCWEEGASRPGSRQTRSWPGEV